MRRLAAERAGGWGREIRPKPSGAETVHETRQVAERARMVIVKRIQLGPGVIGGQRNRKFRLICIAVFKRAAGGGIGHGYRGEREGGQYCCGYDPQRHPAEVTSFDAHCIYGGVKAKQNTIPP